MATQPEKFFTRTFYEITSRVAERQKTLEKKGWIFVSSKIVNDPKHPPPAGETMTALVMKKKLA